ncbi:MAG: DUF58 domain-containing protein [Alphaproteobacteria bacterium]
MIYPTRFAVLLMAFGAPVCALLAVLRSELWSLGLVWIAAGGVLLLLDALMCASGRRLAVALTTPEGLYMGRSGQVRIDAGFGGRGPGSLDIALGGNDKLKLSPDRGRTRMKDGGGALVFDAEPLRRGAGEISKVWLRWRGPLGLVWRQKLERPARRISIVPNIAAVREEAIRLFSRQASFGIKIQREAGEGAEFHALRDFQPGMDIRSVDWKQSARHARLLAKEHRTERNHHIVFAIDSGRTMSEPLAGLPRLDRALNAALLLAFVSLKLGDRVGIFGFDSRVRVASGVVSGVRGFTALQHLAAGIDYSVEETNFTLGLSTLAGDLERRSLIVIFTDFPDSISAELMIENTERLLKRHVVLFIAMRDVDLENLARAEPKTPDDVSRAVTAGALLAERDLVLRRLRHIGVEILEAPLDAIGPDLVSAYLALKQRNVL